ncbi:kinase-like domain-containing protein [Mycena rebaudengoi]|nr:kinase-like domain-containing protein [Mycena rebaudengoi]
MADDVDTIDPTVCINLDPNSSGESCGGIFDHKDTTGLCAMCFIATTNATRAEAMKDWPQCTGCSAQLKLLKVARCGSCLRKDEQIAAAAVPPCDSLGTQDQNLHSETDSTTKTIQQLQAEARRHSMLARTLPKGASKSSAGSASLQAAVAKGALRNITIYLVPVTSNGTRTEASRMLANATRSFPEDMLMTEALVHLLRHWNLDWEKDCSESLTPEHISLRLLGNVGIQPHSTLGTLGHFFDTHDRAHGNHPKKILQGPTNLKLPGPAIYLEGLISVKDFENQTGTLAPYFVHTERENRKRKGSQTSRNHLTAELSSSKRVRSQPSAPVPLRSEYGDVPGFSKVAFAFASVSVAQDGAIILNGLPWVAKRFINIGTGEGQVEIQENHEQVVKEVGRLSRLAYFLQRFVAEAQRKGVDIDQGIQVTDFKLGVEVVQSDTGPSTASGFSLEQYQTACEAQTNSDSNPGIVVWLFEPRRSSKVKHWSGTNEYPPWPQHKLGSTLNAFTHYAYILSLESAVFADLQTATVVDEDGHGIQVLFDVMTHTLNGSSGVGDHGKVGIDTFLKKHQCVNRCHHLRLSCDGFESNPEPVPEDSEED